MIGPLWRKILLRSPMHACHVSHITSPVLRHEAGKHLVCPPLALAAPAPAHAPTAIGVTTPATVTCSSCCAGGITTVAVLLLIVVHDYLAPLATAVGSLPAARRPQRRLLLQIKLGINPLVSNSCVQSL